MKIKKTKALTIVTSLSTFSNVVCKKDTTIVMRYPEAYNHPKQQIQIARDIGVKINNGERIILITHSDYILKEINNLIMLWVLENKHSWNKTQNTPSGINPDNIEYYIVEDGNLREVFVDSNFGLEESSFDNEMIAIDEIASDLAISLSRNLP